MVAGTKVWRRPQKRADYLLRYRPNLMVAVVEAKASHKSPADGLQQAKEYAQILDLKFAYATNGHGIVEHDFLTGRDTDLDEFPSADELWRRLQGHIGLRSEEQKQRFLAPTLPVPGKPLRYYQEIAINRVIRAILGGQRRVLLNMATGTGKTDVAFHICWKLWSTRWNRAGEISERDAKEMLAEARTFREELLGWLKKRHPTLAPRGGTQNQRADAGRGETPPHDTAKRGTQE